MKNPFKKRPHQPLPTAEKDVCKSGDDDGLGSSGDENQERGNWSSQVDFILSCIGYAVGLGNIWRFPYLCMRNGGGAFLIPYFTCLLLCGMPLFCLELALGQYASSSAITIWKISPLFKGLGWAMVIISAFCTLYYNTIIAWVLYYLGKSFASTLPWTSCTSEWNTDTCYRRGELYNNATYQTNSSLGGWTGNSTVPPVGSKTAAEEFWQYNVLKVSDGIEHIGGVRLELLACLAVAWIIIFFCLIKGIKSSGKVVYITATAPYIILIILAVRGLTLPGAAKGIYYYITPDWSRLLDLRTWAEACLQIFYSLGPGWGGVLTMASYNKFHNNCIRDGVVIPLVNSLTSFFAGFVIFSIIGFMASEANLPVEEVINSGPGLAFSAYPEALSRLPVSPVWGVCFFTMLLTLGLDTQFCLLETLVSSITDEYKHTLMRWRTCFTAAICLSQFLVGIIFVTNAGIYFFAIVDWYCAVFSLPLVSLIESLVVVWVYGFDRISDDIERMIGSRPFFIWKILWGIVTPALLLAMIFFSMWHTSEPTYGDYTYPRWAIVLGWIIGTSSSIPIPVCAMIAICQQKGTLWQRIKAAARPAPDWGPALAVNRDDFMHDRQMAYLSTPQQYSLNEKSDPTV